MVIINEPTILASNTDTPSNDTKAHSNPNIKLMNSKGTPSKVELLIQLLICCNDGKRDHKLLNFFCFKMRYKIKYNTENTNSKRVER